ncbi:MAG: hypothetical protein WAX14_23135 [Rhodococcus sp. (in: high G+C Gram-positive bacteria)]|uniref:hypothetical protein n=1 Tax=Rhodococcus sp. TaxID=1831 RepID=UPI003BB50E18
MTNVMDEVRAGWRLSYDRVAVAEILSDGELESGAAIARAAAGDRDGLDTIREIVNVTGCYGVWEIDGENRGVSQVCAEFTCDDEGNLTNDYHLTLSVFLDSGVLVADAGLSDMRSLPCTELVTVYDVLDGVTTLLNESLTRAARTLVSATAPALRMVPVTELRNAVATEAMGTDQIPPIPDHRLEQALIDSWPLVADRYRQMHTELLAAAHRALGTTDTPSREAPTAAREDKSSDAHTIVIGVDEGALTITWPTGTTDTVERDEPATADLYEGLCDALDAIEIGRSAHCPFHDGDERHAAACMCDDPTTTEEV